MQQLLAQLHTLTLNPANAERLKQLVLELAVRGKLTEQWRKENPITETGTQTITQNGTEPASVLLERIQTEKAQLIKEKKIKKEKPLPPIDPDEIPYKLPEGWVWCRLVDISEYIQRGKSPKYTDEPSIPVISQKCVQWKGFELNKARFIEPDSLNKYGEERFLQIDDLLWNSTGDGTIGRATLFPNLDAYSIAVADSHVTVVRLFKKEVSPKYVWSYVASPSVQESLAGKVTGSTKQTELGTGTVKSHLFPLPPLAEQKAIVSIVDELMERIDTLTEEAKVRIQTKHKLAEAALHHLTLPGAVQPEANFSQRWQFVKSNFKLLFDDKTTVKKLRESILQLAVQGKLTEQWRKENSVTETGTHAITQNGTEPASVLLERIQIEKAQLIKEKKIKKEKPLPPIDPDENPYDLPEGWVWCRLGDISLSSEAGKSFTCENRAVENQEWGILKVSAVSWGEFLERENKFYSYEEPGHSQYRVERGDFILSRANTSDLVGKSVVVKNCEYNLLLSDKTIRFKHSGYIDVDFVNLYNNSASARNYYLKVASGSSSSMKNITREQMRYLTIPLPSLAEQKAIVSIVDQLMSLCDQLQTQAVTAKEQEEALMQALMHQVFRPKEEEFMPENAESVF